MWTLSAGNLTLSSKSVVTSLGGEKSPIRDAFDQLGLVGNLSSLLNSLFLCSERVC